MSSKRAMRKRNALVRRAQERAIEMRANSPWDAQLVEDLLALVLDDVDGKSPVERAMALIEDQFAALEPQLRRAFITRFRAVHERLNAEHK